MERIKSVTMLIISFPVSGTAPQEARLLGLGGGRKAVWNLEGEAQVSRLGVAQC